MNVNKYWIYINIPVVGGSGVVGGNGENNIEWCICLDCTCYIH